MPILTWCTDHAMPFTVDVATMQGMCPGGNGHVFTVKRGLMGWEPVDDVQEAS